jgi:hypothetical protein
MTAVTTPSTGWWMVTTPSTGWMSASLLQTTSWRRRRRRRRWRSTSLSPVRCPELPRKTAHPMLCARSW